MGRAAFVERPVDSCDNRLHFLVSSTFSFSCRRFRILFPGIRAAVVIHERSEINRAWAILYKPFNIAFKSPGVGHLCSVEILHVLISLLISLLEPLCFRNVKFFEILCQCKGTFVEDS